MKEYWVNVYEPLRVDITPKMYGCGHNNLKDAEYCVNLGMRKHSYRLHVREFETKEAKELYLKMKLW